MGTPQSTAPPSRSRREVAIGEGEISIAQLRALARGELLPRLTNSPVLRTRLEASCRTLEAALEGSASVYGVTTGVGSSVENAIPAELRGEMPHNLFRFHGCGTGRFFDETEAAAIVAVRLVTLAKGYSGVRLQVLERLCDLLSRRILPCIPEEGSVGASGDLTPLSYLAALLAGEREAIVGGEIVDAQSALRDAELEPLALGPKESLAIMNGTAAMTALACLNLDRVAKLSRVASTVTAMLSAATRGNPEHFDEKVLSVKPHIGTMRAGAWIRDLLGARRDGAPAPLRLQDRYSIRCAPHVIGVLIDGAEMAERLTEIELNGVDDNPIADPDSGRVLHGGNFYGGHICFAMDALKSATASVADLLDRQLALVCIPETSGALPANLVWQSGPDAVVHHGFKAMQISASALTAEALKLTMPASAFSRSTESHNQDKVSMGTIAARDLRRILELTENVAMIGLLAACQAFDLRSNAHRGEADTTSAFGERLTRIHDAVRQRIPPVTIDRRQDHDIEALRELLDQGIPDIDELED